jgi:hypothetical protein
MTSEAVLREPSAPILNRIAGWQLLALGLGGWVALYSSATVNFQKGLAELTGHAQGVCFACVMVLGGGEARKRKRARDHKAKLNNALKWVGEMSDTRFEEQLSMHFHRLEYRLESMDDAHRAMGFGLRVVRDGRTTFVHTGFWRAGNVDGERLARLAEGSDIESLAADRVLLLTRAEVSETTRKRMSSNSWTVVSGMEFAKMTRNFQVTSEAPTPVSQDTPDNNQDTRPGETERIQMDYTECLKGRFLRKKRPTGLLGLFRSPFHNNLVRGSVRKKR